MKGQASCSCACVLVSKGQSIHSFIADFIVCFSSD